MRNLKSEKGTALLETALTLPLLLAVAVGIFEFGRAYQTWQVLTNAAREGAKVAVVAGSTDAQVESVVRSYMRAGQLPNAATAPVALGSDIFVEVVGYDHAGTKAQRTENPRVGADQ